MLVTSKCYHNKYDVDITIYPQLIHFHLVYLHECKEITFCLFPDLTEGNKIGINYKELCDSIVRSLKEKSLYFVETMSGGINLKFHANNHEYELKLTNDLINI